MAKKNDNATGTPKTRNMAKIERPGKSFEFLNIGDTAAGTIQKVTSGNTQFGEAEFLQMVTDEGEDFSVCVSSNLTGYDWESMTGVYVEIEYTGNEKNPNTKRTYKVYEVRAEIV